ncbi:MAG: 4a-hydroxytetrahydrobiopterin dehydratase [Burkholderiaceae bacterium]
MKTTEQLLASHCREMKGAAMSDAEVAAQLKALDGWTLDAGALTKTYRFKNYYETLAFVNALAFMIHREDHHPDLNVGYNRCEVRYNTHSVNGISENDFISAAKADAIYSFDTE